MTILIDIDSTITNFAEVLLKYLNKEHHTNYTVENITYWDWFIDTFADPWKPLKDKKFWDEVQVLPEAVKAVESLVKAKNKVYLVTASFFTDTLGLKIRNVLKAFYPVLEEKNVIVAHDKSTIIGDFMIDDNYHNLITSRCPHKILYAQPWNASIKELCSVNDWSMIVALINSF